MIDRRQKVGQRSVGLFPRSHPRWPVMVQGDAKYVIATRLENAPYFSEAQLVSGDVLEDLGADHQVEGLIGIRETANVLAFYATRAHLAEGDVREALRRRVGRAGPPKGLMEGAVATDLEDAQVWKTATKDVQKNGPRPPVMGNRSATKATQADYVEGASPEMETAGPAQDTMLVFREVTDGTRQYFQQLHLGAYSLHGDARVSRRGRLKADICGGTSA